MPQPKTGAGRKLRVGEKARCLEASSLCGLLNQVQSSLQDSVKLWRFRWGELLAHAAFVEIGN